MTAKKIDAPENTRKRKRIVPTRAAGTPAFEHPADDYFAVAFAHRDKKAGESAELVEKETPPTMVTVPAMDTMPSHGQKKTAATAPVSNFQKVTNTITKEAIPQGLFKPGKSKQIYDVLYGLTRGAIVPVRTIRISKPKLRKLSGVGARTTMDACLVHLEQVGLISQKINDGGFHDGNDFEVFTPEEITPLTMVTPSSHGSHGNDASKQAMVGSLDSSHGRQGSELVNIGTKDTPKTSLKTIEKNDDEAFGKMNETLAKVFEKVSGKRPQKKDAEKLNELAEFLAMELEIAAARAKSVSNVPAFLTEHLRRRLLKREASLPSKQSGKVSGKLSGKQESELPIYDPEPLSEQGREAVLRTMREYIAKGQKDFVFGQRESYTESDWQWLTKNLETKGGDAV